MVVKQTGCSPKKEGTLAKMKMTTVDYWVTVALPVPMAPEHQQRISEV